ncbi:hypothetical protein DPMN_100647 [Dreissena polymorpha]|uniref:Uncharacterized protein n=1 Tax=Dreissena polymorpha TaxID=45954 RepID=A0A9D4R8E2_DREPO|nr:hypothetical protein DPMN_100647 [Dreissena polymorpha]
MILIQSLIPTRFSHFVKCIATQQAAFAIEDCSLGTTSDRARNPSGRQKFASVVSYLHKWPDRES